MEEVKDYLEGGKLPKKRIIEVRPNVDNPGWVRDPQHAAFFLLENTSMRFMLPSLRKGVFANALTKEEKLVLEKAMDDGTDLSVYKKQGKDSFWTSFVVKIDKYGLTLDLSNPMDYLSLKVLLMNGSIVAPSYTDRLNKSTYKFYISDGKAEAREVKKSVDRKAKAYIEFGKMSSSPTKMKAFLKVYNLVTKGTSVKFDKDANTEFLTNELSAIVDENYGKFLEFVEDPHFDTRLLIAEGIEKGVIRKNSEQGYSTADGVVLGKTLFNAVSFLNIDSNQDVLFGIQARIKGK